MDYALNDMGYGVVIHFLNAVVSEMSEPKVIKQLERSEHYRQGIADQKEGLKFNIEMKSARGYLISLLGREIIN